MTVSFAASAAGFAMATVSTIRAAWSMREASRMIGALLWAGVTVLALAGLVFLTAIPNSSEPPAAVVIRLMAYAGLGLVAVGISPLLVARGLDAVRSRDPGLVVALIAFALLLLVAVVTRT